MMGPMPPLPTHPYRPATGPPHPHIRRDTWQDSVVGYQEVVVVVVGGRFIYACPSIVSGGKKWQHRVQFFSPQSSPGPAREARLTDDSQHLCYAAVTDEGLCVAVSLSVCLWDTPPLLPLSILLAQHKEWQTSCENYPEMAYNDHFV